MTLDELNHLDIDSARDFFRQCCTSDLWLESMANNRPYSNQDELLSTADKSWSVCKENDYLQAFEGHSKIGDVSSLKAKYANTSDMAGHEQSGASTASDETLKALAEGNTVYQTRFGYIFIVCATGKSADEMLSLLNDRLDNHPENELEIAAAEQHKITRLRLNKLIEWRQMA
ncbi:2-oxo-4-hydroxy-4-carboxy-5-ureidoimidazoline decarboxylase [Endozoicomonas sp. SCSIO W0465]|uniref:2-oxo-4-hydroxy-4-carboxy-5-ureidoimidazoline decarboxylase n=1 Tax=Endozoicomonas sp. SCSIO W0465 TaxID=2918516 RepID=UPI0020756B74|nr:2-oxo-4-hydroxy-4-carboxy-5-ureidoimidazoline decarboxylase [Endozoicomonas sp. SCSIO W0465]USE36500.1 2-oxo-4-hydroxy-4-carboxy-5-ureidoimidazoline decarboxylase [Endozoicomonas sp. SCSIO W0465]